MKTDRRNFVKMAGAAVAICIKMCSVAKSNIWRTIKNNTISKDIIDEGKIDVPILIIDESFKTFIETGFFWLHKISYREKIYEVLYFKSNKKFIYWDPENPAIFGYTENWYEATKGKRFLMFINEVDKRKNLETVLSPGYYWKTISKNKIVWY